MVGQIWVHHCIHTCTDAVSHECKLCFSQSLKFKQLHFSAKGERLTGSITCGVIRLTDKAFQFPLDFHRSLHEVQTTRAMQGESMLSLIPYSIWNAIALSHILLPICHTRPPYSSNLIPEQRAPLIWRLRDWRRGWRDSTVLRKQRDELETEVGIHTVRIV